MSDKGLGVAITYSSGYMANITALSWDGMSRPAQDTTTFAATSGVKTFEPAGTVDPGSLSVDFLFDPGVASPIMAGDAAEAVTVTWSNAGLSTWAQNGFMTDMSISAADVDSHVRASATIKLSGVVTVTP